MTQEGMTGQWVCLMRLLTSIIGMIIGAGTGPALAAAEPLVAFVQPADYPAAALAAKAAGDVTILLQILPDGQLRCMVTDKAAPALLRRPSCQLIASRWPFYPDADRKGVPQTTDVPMLVRWILPSAQTPSAGGFDGATPLSIDRWLVDADYPLISSIMGNTARLRIMFDVTPEGHIGNCAVEKRNGAKDLARLVCPLVEKRALLLPAIGPDGKARTAKGQINVTFRVPGRPFTAAANTHEEE